MSKRKDRKRAEHFIFRDGRYIPRAQWDKYQRELVELKDKQEKNIKEAKEIERLKKIGLVKGKADILTPEQIAEEKRPTKKEVRL